METIGKYVIEKKLGQGGMGIVYKCHDPEMDREAAVKVLPQQLATDPVFQQRFKREVMTMERLDHPHIVHVYDYGTEDGASYYAMEFVDGTGLESMLQSRQKMEPLQAIGIVRACAEALEHSHSRGIIHRDIKPANIMINLLGEVKLTDFGIAKVLDATRMTMTQAVLGTVEYMSPEQSQGRHVDARSDLYSLGVVLYQCLTGRLPITGTTSTEIIMKLRTQAIDPPNAWVPDLPKNLSDLVMKLLEKEPSRRIESAHALINELDRIRQQIESGVYAKVKAGTADRVLTTGEQPTPLWRNPWLLVFVVVVAAFWIWVALKHQPVETSIPAPPRERSMQAGLILKWARNADRQGQYEYAVSLCDLIIKYFPNTSQAEEAQKEIAWIFSPTRDLDLGMPATRTPVEPLQAPATSPK